jgi:hypothetical protein
LAERYVEGFFGTANVRAMLACLRRGRVVDASVSRKGLAAQRSVQPMHGHALSEYSPPPDFDRQDSGVSMFGEHASTSTRVMSSQAILRLTRERWQYLGPNDGESEANDKRRPRTTQASHYDLVSLENKNTCKLFICCEFAQWRECCGSM